jgi:hypothetical protein
MVIFFWGTSSGNMLHSARVRACPAEFGGLCESGFLFFNSFAMGDNGASLFFMDTIHGEDIYSTLLNREEDLGVFGLIKLNHLMSTI